MTTLSPAERQTLKGLAHRLEPVVLIGNAGLSAAVLKEIDSALKAHELIKIKASGAERDDRDAWMTQICESLSAQPVQHIGKTLVIFRPNPEKDKQSAPAKKSASKATKGKGKKAAGKAAAGKGTAPRKTPLSRSAVQPGAGRAPRPTTRKAKKPGKPIKKSGTASSKSSRTPL